jgi:SNF2 family DNA or RNA helicase
MNILLEKYGENKRTYLENSPFSCLLSSDIEYNPHQIDAFCAAIDSLKTGGIILADEVGLGKTIEAGLVLKYMVGKGAKNILIVLPSSLRMQWKMELQEKFGFKELEVRILTNNVR